jgi:thioredoxin 1
MRNTILVATGTVLILGLAAVAWMRLGASERPESDRAEAESGAERRPGARALEINDGDMESLKSGVVLVDFWATWCPPCRAQGPIVDALAGRFSGRAVVAKANVDEAKATAGSYGIRSIPTLILFRDGREVERFVGLQTEAKLAAAIEKELAGG